MSEETVYVVTDVEFDGPVPGRHSMLAFASVALTAAGRRLGEFEATLAPLPGAATDPETMAFWHRHPEGWAAATADPQPPEAVMRAFVAWVRALPGAPVFAAHPVALDGAWLDHYLQRFTPERLFEGPWRPDRLFRHAPFCLMAFAAGRTGWDFTRCDVGRYPPDWLGHHEHSHRAIDDARGYASLLATLMAAPAAAPAR